MLFIPVANLTLKSKLSTENILGTLGSNLKSPEESGFTGKNYRGEITGNNFTMTRIAWRSSWKPEISGTVEQGFDGSSIGLKFQLRSIAKLYLIASLCIFTFMEFTIYRAFFIIHHYSNAQFILFIIPGIALMYYFMVIGSFNWEYYWAKKDLKNWLQAEEVEKLES